MKNKQDCKNGVCKNICKLEVERRLWDDSDDPHVSVYPDCDQVRIAKGDTEINVSVELAIVLSFAIIECAKEIENAIAIYLKHKRKMKGAK